MLSRKWIFVPIAAMMLAALAVPAFAQEATPSVDAVAAEADAPAMSGMVTGLWHLHAWVRWLIVVVAVVALVKMAVGLSQNDVYDSLARRLMQGFAILITLQWLIGIVFFLAFGGFNVRYRWEHAAVMTVAVAVAHFHNRWRSAEPGAHYRANLIIIAVVLVLIFVGVALLPQGWRMMPAI